MVELERRHSVHISQRELEKRIYHLKTVFDVSQVLGSLRTIQEITNNQLMMIMGTFGAISGVMVVVDSNRNNIEAITQRGMDKTFLDKIHEAIESGNYNEVKGVTGVQILDGKDNVEKKEKKNIFELLSLFKMRIWMPLEINEKLWGGIGLGDKLSEDPYTPDDQELLATLTKQGAVAIERILLYEEAKVAEMVKLLGDISHDIKNLIMPVVTAEKLLDVELKEIFDKRQGGEADNLLSNREMCDEIMGMLRSSTRRIQERMKEIADCVKGLSAPPQFAECLIVDVVKSVIKTLGMPATEKGISLQTEGLTELPIIHADEGRLFNAFYNLVNNALEEVPQGGSITLCGHGIIDGKVKVSVVDTGRGMPREVRESLFSASAISRKPGGTGLGTKIIKDVIDAHHGMIAVESEEGVGTTFLLHLPIQQPGVISR